MSPEVKVWFVTGASSGFGLAITEHALRKGDKVVATLRKPEVLSTLASAHPTRLLLLPLDVTDPAQVSAAFAASLAAFGRVDVVVNNAGFGVVSEVEGTRETSARAVMEVNFWGASHVSREAIRCFREGNQPPGRGGRLLQMSSMSGVRASAGIAYYSASKFALEALSECLAEELDPKWNIKLTILEPGPFLTKCSTVNLIKDPVHPAYTDPSPAIMHIRNVFDNPLQAFDGDPNKFAEAVYRVACLEDPPLRLPIHKIALDVIRKKAKELVEVADKWESWSEDVLL